MAARQVVDPTREHDREPLVGQVAQEEGQQIPRRAVDPVDVFDDEECRGRRAESTDQAEQTLEQARLAEAAGERWGFGVGRSLVVGGCRGGSGHREQARQQQFDVFPGRPKQPIRFRVRGVPDEATDRLSHRQIGQPTVADIETAAGQDPIPLSAHAVGDFPDQPGLADACLTGDDDHPGSTRARL